MSSKFDLSSPAGREPSAQASREMRRRLFLFMCWLYVALGVGCLGAGLYLLAASYHVTSAAELHSLGAIRALAGVLIAFGVWRGGLALFHMGRVLRRR